MEISRVHQLLHRAENWLNAHEPRPTRRIRLRTALAGTLALYLVGWGEGLYAAIAYLVRGRQLHQQYAPGVDLVQLGIQFGAAAGAVVLAALLIVHHVCGTWAPLRPHRLRPPTSTGAGHDAQEQRPAPGRPQGREREPLTGWPRWRLEIIGASWSTMLTIVSFGLGMLVHITGDYPLTETRAGNWTTLFGAATAGPTEELALLVAPLLLLRAARLSWPWVFAVLVLERVSFHIYYGPGAAFLILWAAGMVALYVRTGAVLGFIVEHCLYDLTSVPLAFGHPTAAAILKGILIVGTLLIAGAHLSTRAPDPRSPYGRGLTSLCAGIIVWTGLWALLHLEATRFHVAILTPIATTLTSQRTYFGLVAAATSLAAAAWTVRLAQARAQPAHHPATGTSLEGSNTAENDADKQESM